MRFANSAEELARRGYDCSPATPVRILLACQEANAAALLGDAEMANSTWPEVMHGLLAPGRRYSSELASLA